MSNIHLCCYCCSWVGQHCSLSKIVFFLYRMVQLPYTWQVYLQASLPGAYIPSLSSEYLWVAASNVDIGISQYYQWYTTLEQQLPNSYHIARRVGWDHTLTATLHRSCVLNTIPLTDQANTVAFLTLQKKVEWYGAAWTGYERCRPGCLPSTVLHSIKNSCTFIADIVERSTIYSRKFSRGKILWFS